jgi:exosortase K
MRWGKRKILYAGAIWSGVGVAKFWYNTVTAAELLFILKPLKLALELFGYPNFWLTADGYLNAQNYLISKDCSGFNFWLITTVVLGFAAGKLYQYKAWVLPLTLIGSYLLTQLANISRISCLTLAGNFVYVEPLLHLTIGSLVYLSLLFGFYSIFILSTQKTI